MEEKKEAKVVSMTPQVEKSDKPEKLSYEQLENIAHQLSEQSRQLYMKLQEANKENMFSRLEFLFRVVENRGAFNSEFLNKCIKEIEYLMTIPEEDSKTDK